MRSDLLECLEPDADDETKAIANSLTDDEAKVLLTKIWDNAVSHNKLVTFIRIYELRGGVNNAYSYRARVTNEIWSSLRL